VFELDQALTVLDQCLVSMAEADLPAVFDATFLAQLPAVQLAALFKRLGAQVGSCTGHEVVAPLSEHSARVRWRFDRGFHVDGVVGVSARPPHKIVFLNFGMPSRNGDSWEQIEEAIRALPGEVSFAVRALPGGPVLASVEPDRALGAGSVSKLLIFSTLLTQIADGRRHWEDLVTLRPEHISAPTGIMHTWPIGSLMTLHTVAVLLVSYSDNTAADLLLQDLGEHEIEGTMAALGVGQHPSSRPFVSTRGLFRLVTEDPSVHHAYVHGNERTRRELLHKAARVPPQVGDQTTEPWPPGLGWYLSAAEVCRVLDHLRGQIDQAPVAKAILGMSPCGVATDQWKFVGYKGGSSPGRMALAALLEDKAGRFVAACLISNASPETVDVDGCATLMKRATDLALVHCGEADVEREEAHGGR
jgi:hypothetical protein